jgi:hypothetical protein
MTGLNDMKRQTIVALADACGVTIEWLAAGRGPMRPSDSHPAPPPPEHDRGLFASVHVDKLAGCFEGAQNVFAARGIKVEPRRLVQVALLLYDAMDAPDANLDAIAKVLTAPASEMEEPRLNLHLPD